MISMPCIFFLVEPQSIAISKVFLRTFAAPIPHVLLLKLP